MKFFQHQYHPSKQARLKVGAKNRGYKAKIVYKTTDETSVVRNRRSNSAKKISWFTPTYDMAVANKLGKIFFLDY